MNPDAQFDGEGAWLIAKGEIRKGHHKIRWKISKFIHKKEVIVNILLYYFRLE